MPVKNSNILCQTLVVSGVDWAYDIFSPKFSRRVEKLIMPPTNLIKKSGVILRHSKEGCQIFAGGKHVKFSETIIN